MSAWRDSFIVLGALVVAHFYIARSSRKVRERAARRVFTGRNRP